MSTILIENTAHLEGMEPERVASGGGVVRHRGCSGCRHDHESGAECATHARLDRVSGDCLCTDPACLAKDPVASVEHGIKYPSGRWDCGQCPHVGSRCSDPDLAPDDLVFTGDGGPCTCTDPKCIEAAKAKVRAVIQESLDATKYVPVDMDSIRLDHGQGLAPAKDYAFKVEINGLPAAGFNGVTIPDHRVEEDGTVTQGRPSFGSVTMEIDAGPTAQSWFDEVTSYQKARRSKP